MGEHIEHSEADGSFNDVQAIVKYGELHEEEEGLHDHELARMRYEVGGHHDGDGPDQVGVDVPGVPRGVGEEVEEGESDIELFGEQKLHYETCNVPGMPSVRDRGSIRICIGGGQITAQCYRCRYRFNRQFDGYKGKNTKPQYAAKGRPMGFLLAWLKLDCKGDFTWHKYQQHCVPFRGRKAARAHYFELGLLRRQFERERILRVAEEPEPLHDP